MKRLALVAIVLIAFPTTTSAGPTVGPIVITEQVLVGMPRGERQQILVQTATFPPGGQTVHHEHRFPVTVFVAEGTFRMDFDGRPPVVVEAGQSYIEPPDLPMTGRNPSPTAATKVVIFYVTEPGQPFFDRIEAAAG